MTAFYNETPYTLVVDIGSSHEDGSFSLQAQLIVFPQTVLRLKEGFTTSVRISQVTPPPAPPKSEGQQALDDIMKSIEQYGDRRESSASERWYDE